MNNTNTNINTVARSIFVVDGGFVFRVESAERQGDMWITKGADVIRVWGTTKGLGEIALNGPTAKTVLDPCGDVFIPVRQVRFICPCVGQE